MTGHKALRLTLGSFVNPLKGHSLVSGGASTAQALACAIQGSLMTFTTNSFIVLMFLAVSFTGPVKVVFLVIEKEITGGNVET